MKKKTKLLIKDSFFSSILTSIIVLFLAITFVNITFFNHFFIQGEFKTGYINMPNIRTTEFKSDSAKQDFFFYQRNFSIGYIFQLIK